MTINEILETMDYGTAPETASEALAWLDKNRPFGNFINGKMTDAGNTFCVTSPATGDELARVTQATAADVDAAVAAVRAAGTQGGADSSRESARSNARGEASQRRRIQCG